MESEINNWVNTLLRRGGPWLRAEEAYGQGRYQDALRLYDEALRTARRKSRLRTERSRLFALVGNHQAALTEMELAIQEMRREDARDLVFLYESKALLEHGVGMLHERLGNRDAAREAYAAPSPRTWRSFPPTCAWGCSTWPRASTTPPSPRSTSPRRPPPTRRCCTPTAPRSRSWAGWRSRRCSWYGQRKRRRPHAEERVRALAPEAP